MAQKASQEKVALQRRVSYRTLMEMMFSGMKYSYEHSADIIIPHLVMQMQLNAIDVPLH